MQSYSREQLGKIPVIEIGVIDRNNDNVCIREVLRSEVDKTKVLTYTIEQAVEHAIANFNNLDPEAKMAGGRIAKTVKDEGENLCYSINGKLVTSVPLEGLDLSEKDRERFAGSPTSVINDERFLEPDLSMDGKKILRCEIHVGNINDFIQGAAQYRIGQNRMFRNPAEYRA